MSTSVEALPDEVLEQIFAYCSCKDLAKSVQNVSTRWRLVSQSTRVWKYCIYSPRPKETKQKITKTLKMCPRLMAVNLRKHRKSVFDVLTENCPELKKLEMNYKQYLSRTLLEHLQERCPRIEHLKISNSILCSEEKFQIIGRFTNLKSLITGRSGRHYISLLPIADGCPNLEHLELSDTWYEIDDLEYLVQKKKDQLHTLRLRCYDERHYSQCTIPVLSVCTVLKSLSILGYCGNSFEPIVQTLGSLGTLISLSWSRMEDVKDEDDVKRLFMNRNMAHLQELKIDSCSCYTDAVTKVIVRNCPRLQRISLGSRCTDECLRMMQSLKELKSVSIIGHHFISDLGVRYLKQIQGLKYLFLCKCWTLTRASLYLITEFWNLEVLHLEEQYLEGFPVRVIAKQLKKLKELHVRQCYNVDYDDLKWLKFQMPHLRILVTENSKKVTF